MTYYIYSLSVGKRKPIYIGITRNNLQVRLKQHRNNCFRKTKISNQKIYILLRKLGITKSNFLKKVKIKILKKTNAENRFKDEVKFRKKMKPVGNSDTMS